MVWLLYGDQWLHGEIESLVKLLLWVVGAAGMRFIGGGDRDASE